MVLVSRLAPKKKPAEISNVNGAKDVRHCKVCHLPLPLPFLYLLEGALVYPYSSLWYYITLEACRTQQYMNQCPNSMSDMCSNRTFFSGHGLRRARYRPPK